MTKTVVITGASSGIGAALAETYSGKGITLGLLGRNAERLGDISSRCEALGATVHVGEIDVTEKEELIKWLLAFDDEHKIDVIVANAGIIKTLDKNDIVEDVETIERIFSTNVFGTIHTVNPVIKRMQHRGTGAVAIISSLSAYRGMPLFPAYSASKAATKTYYEAIRGRLSSYGISVTIVTPSFIMTPMTEDSGIPDIVKTSVKQAANHIKQGIEANAPLVNFPLHHVICLNILRVFFPERFSDWLLRKVFRL
jgi:short-subunit dehydrogenase